MTQCSKKLLLSTAILFAMPVSNPAFAEDLEDGFYPISASASASSPWGYAKEAVSAVKKSVQFKVTAKVQDQVESFIKEKAASMGSLAQSEFYKLIYQDKSLVGKLKNTGEEVLIYKTHPRLIQNIVKNIAGFDVELNIPGSSFITNPIFKKLDAMLVDKVGSYINDLSTDLFADAVMVAVCKASGVSSQFLETQLFRGHNTSKFSDAKAPLESSYAGVSVAQAKIEAPKLSSARTEALENKISRPNVSRVAPKAQEFEAIKNKQNTNMVVSEADVTAALNSKDNKISSKEISNFTKMINHYLAKTKIHLNSMLEEAVADAAKKYSGELADHLTLTAENHIKAGVGAAAVAGAALVNPTLGTMVSAGLYMDKTLETPKSQGYLNQFSKYALSFFVDTNKQKQTLVRAAHEKAIVTVQKNTPSVLSITPAVLKDAYGTFTHNYLKDSEDLSMSFVRFDQDEAPMSAKVFAQKQAQSLLDAAKNQAVRVAQKTRDIAVSTKNSAAQSYQATLDDAANREQARWEREEARRAQEDFQNRMNDSNYNEDGYMGPQDKKGWFGWFW